jgi:MoaA/NifB/PqqE/SkfB family radical SAM enzyme
MGVELDISSIHFDPPAPADARLEPAGYRGAAMSARIAELVAHDDALAERFRAVYRWGSRVRVSEYHLTNACNIRCKGCWFFEYEHDQETREEKNLAVLEEFVLRERSERKINGALIIGGEPALFPDRLRVFLEHMKYCTISSNGYKKVPYEGFEQLTVGLSLFGGGALDDELRAIKPGGTPFTGLFERALDNYRGDPRAGFVYALTEDGIGYIEETVRRIRQAGLIVNFNFYSKYGTDDPTAQSHQRELLDEALRVRALFPDTVVSHPYFIRAIITGATDWGRFGYDSCPSISIDHPAHAERLRNGNPSLPLFNTYAADLKTVKFCCTSGHCNGCRDSQAVLSWLLVSLHRFLDSAETLRTWVEVSEAYWSQFVWSPYNRRNAAAQPAAAAAS